MRQDEGNSIVVLERFMQATRDSGYKGTLGAVAELVDNAIQADARQIIIVIHGDGTHGKNSLTVKVTDNGQGMGASTLKQALRFGGSTRFDNRTGLGRYGMGLPNSSLSQTRRVEVCTWVSPRKVYASFLDLDDVVGQRLRHVPEPIPATLPKTAAALKFRSGTEVVWNRCDRLDHHRASTIVNKLQVFLGRVFRYFLWKGIYLEINGEPVKPIDPLFLHKKAQFTGARAFGTPLKYKVKIPLPKRPRKITSSVIVTFSELPVEKWHHLSNNEKTEWKISKGAGVSIVRAGRELDYGWFLMGKKRKENYDDWWRCEIQFSPDLDEHFGVTHTKQQIHPTKALQAILSQDLEVIARKLNTRVRERFIKIKGETLGKALRVAAEKEPQLKPIPQKKVTRSSLHGATDRLRYRITHEPFYHEYFYRWRLDKGELLIILNRNHPFYDCLYSSQKNDADTDSRILLEFLLLAMARVEAGATNRIQKRWYQTNRLEISNALNAFLGG